LIWLSFTKILALYLNFPYYEYPWETQLSRYLITFSIARIDITPDKEKKGVTEKKGVRSAIDYSVGLAYKATA
jgi:hypothetical protein